MQFKKYIVGLFFCAFCYSAVATDTKPKEIVFESGKSYANIQGEFSGAGYDRLHFRANKGQLVTISVLHTDVDLMFALVSLDHPELDYLRGEQNVLPASGRYELRVMQTRNDARKSKKTQHYEIKLSIKSSTQKENTSSAKPKAADKTHHQPLFSENLLSFRCDDEKVIDIAYIKGQTPLLAIVARNDKHYLLTQSESMSKNNTIVFTGGDYLLSIDKTYQSALPKMPVIVFSQPDKNGDQSVIVQNCHSNN